jgi:hypothetical protein
MREVLIGDEEIGKFTAGASQPGNPLYSNGFILDFSSHTYLFGPNEVWDISQAEYEVCKALIDEYCYEAPAPECPTFTEAEVIQWTDEARAQGLVLTAFVDNANPRVACEFFDGDMKKVRFDSGASSPGSPLNTVMFIENMPDYGNEILRQDADITLDEHNACAAIIRPHCWV